MHLKITAKSYTVGETEIAWEGAQWHLGHFLGILMKTTIFKTEMAIQWVTIGNE